MLPPPGIEASRGVGNRPPQPTMSHPTLERHLRARSLRPVYLLFGEEEFLIRQAVARLQEGLSTQAGEPVAKTIVDAAESELGEVLGQARTPLLWGGHQLFVVLQAERYKAVELKPLQKYLEHPGQDTSLVLVAVGLKAKEVERHSVWGRLSQQEAALGFFRLKDSRLPRWLMDEAVLRGKELPPAAAQRLLETAGHNLMDLSQELDKLVLFVGPEETVISPAAVAQLASRSRSHNIFELVEALGKGQTVRALNVLGGLLDLGEPPPKILVMLARQVRLLLKAKEAAHEGRSPSELAARVGVPGMVADKLVRQARSFQQARLAELLLALHRTDRGLKTSAAPDRLLLEVAVMELCAS